MATAKTTQVNVSPEEHREKLHDIVKDARTVMLLSHGEVKHGKVDLAKH